MTASEGIKHSRQPCSPTCFLCVACTTQPATRLQSVCLSFLSACACPVPCCCCRCHRAVIAAPAESCFVRALAQVDPDANPPCPAVDAASLRTCLTTPSFTRIMVVSDLKLDASEASFPPSMAENPPVIGRNISIESDARGPRMVLDCALLSDRLQVAPGVTVTAWHVVLANCSIGAEKPLIFLRFSQGAQLVMRDSFVLQPTDLCLPVQQQQVALPTETRPASFPSPASQQVRLGNASSWCPAGPYTASAAVSGANNSSTAVRVPPTESPQDNSSYSRLPQIFANRTGLGPAYAAALEQPARVPFYTHPT